MVLSWGLSYSIPPGPVAFEIIKRGLRGRISHSIPIGIGGALADYTYANLVFFGVLKVIKDNLNVQLITYLLGANLLLIISILGMKHVFINKISPLPLDLKQEINNAIS